MFNYYQAQRAVKRLLNDGNKDFLVLYYKRHRLLFAGGHNYEDDIKSVSGDLSNKIEKLHSKSLITQPWGLIVLLEENPTLEDRVKSLLSLNTTLHKILVGLTALIAAAGSLLEVVPNLFPGSPNVQANIKPPQVERIEKIYHNFGYPGPNSIAYWSYKENCKYRELEGFFSPYFKESNLAEIKTRSTKEETWADIFAAHKNGKPYTVRAKDLPTSSFLRQSMQERGIYTVVTQPFGKKDQCPDGYISIAYGRNIEDHKLPVVYTKLADASKDLPV